MTPIQTTAAKMGLKIHPISPNLQFNSFLSTLTPSNFLKLNSNPPKPVKVSRNKEKESVTDEILAMELALEINKLKTHTVRREEALNKSRELLFSEICSFMGLKSEDSRKKWKRMDEEEKWVLVKGFVAEWSANFHPLSAKSVKEMVEEYLGQDDEFEDGGSLFPDLIKFLGFSSNSEGQHI